MTDENGLTLKQKAWCESFLKNGNATQAARDAGYKYPEQSGKDNTRKQPCIAYIDKRLKRTDARRIASADDVLQFLTDTMQGRIKDQFGLEASLQDRIAAAKELMRRYAVADQRAAGTMAKLDAILLEFSAAVQATPTAAIHSSAGRDAADNATQGKP